MVRSTRANGTSSPGTTGMLAIFHAQPNPKAATIKLATPMDATPNRASSHKPSGAPAASDPYEAMPAQEMTVAVQVTATLPIPQIVAPVATQLSPTPRRRRLTTNRARHGMGE